MQKNILLGITGSIAAYKSAELVRLLKDSGADVRVVLSAGAQNFITPMTLQAISGNRVHTELLDAENEAAMSHIKLARWADLILIAPSTSHFIAKLAHGFADDLLTTLCLAATAPIMIAPAMNAQMWAHPATQTNLQILAERNAVIIGPAYGEQACGEVGLGRMVEPEEIVAQVQLFTQHNTNLCGKRFLITAGPTQEAIDPVRYLSNHSSGKMGYAIAKAAVARGATVTLISGPSILATPANVNRIDIITAQEMYEKVIKQIQHCDVFIAAAAVADYRVKQTAKQKIKKTSNHLNLELERNPDILTEVGKLKPRPFIVGFAAETENLIENAKQKLKQKKCDMIVANQVGDKVGFNVDYSELTVITNDSLQKLPHAHKLALAEDLVAIISKKIGKEYQENLIIKEDLGRS